MSTNDTQRGLVGLPNQSSCLHKKCAAWNPLDDSFTMKPPGSFPLVCDSHPGAPLPPKGREVTGEPNSSRRLPTIYLTVDWLEQAVVFAHHQMKTHPPNTPVNKRHWTKTGLIAYLRTCGIGTRLQQAMYESAKKGDNRPPLPHTWNPRHCLQQSHCAAVHMLFLGHVKSNYEMAQKWLTHCELMAPFGKQANKILCDVQALRCGRFFDAHPLSTSKWGTGIWVSENCLFWARAQKFFVTLPAIRRSRHADRDREFQKGMTMILRFASAALACISRLMSEERSVGDMDEVVKLHLDTMVEVDRWIAGNYRDSENEDIAAEDEEVSTSTVPANSRSRRNRRKKSKRKEPSFCKSNSLGILAAAWSHWFLGPATLHWEGSWFGERKIQPAKTETDVKRSNADWQRTVLRNLWQRETITRVLEGMDESEQGNRDMDGVVRVYSSKTTVLTELQLCKPLSVLQDTNGSMWILHRPTVDEFKAGQSELTDKEWSRSSVQAMRVNFLDDNGFMVQDACWFAPVSVDTNDVRSFSSMAATKEIVKQSVLLLPLMSDNGAEYTNNCCGIGNKWTERVSSGEFKRLCLSQPHFQDWLQEGDKSTTAAAAAQGGPVDRNPPDSDPDPAVDEFNFAEI